MKKDRDLLSHLLARLEGLVMARCYCVPSQWQELDDEITEIKKKIKALLK